MRKNKLIGTLTCPFCGHKQKMEIPDKSCVHFYTCESCGKLVKGKDKCIFCSYGDKPCPTGC